MARFVLDPDRVNFTVEPHGKEYNLRVLQRSKTIFSSLMSNLPSPYLSAIQGPSYTQELKAVAVELARIELSLEDIDLDRDYSKTRSEFLYSMIGYLIFLNGRLPTIEYADDEFRRFLLNLIALFFQGALPRTMQDGVALFLDNTTLFENFLLTRSGASGYDISDQFGFHVDVESGNQFPTDIMDVASSLRAVLNIIRPAHTLFTLRHIFTDSYNPNDPAGRILDSHRWTMASYYYDDLRSYWGGVHDRDRLGEKRNTLVLGEEHVQVRRTYRAPLLQFVTPYIGDSVGGVLITLNGRDLANATAVTIGDRPCTSVVTVNNGEVTCRTPLLSPGNYVVNIATPGGDCDWVTFHVPGGIVVDQVNNTVVDHEETPVIARTDT